MPCCKFWLLVGHEVYVQGSKVGSMNSKKGYIRKLLQVMWLNMKPHLSHVVLPPSSGICFQKRQVTIHKMHAAKKKSPAFFTV
jgi:hypothetical protein